MSEENAAPILSRDAFIAKLTAAIGDSRLNFSGMDIAAHDAAQREEIQRLTEDQKRIVATVERLANILGGEGPELPKLVDDIVAAEKRLTESRDAISALFPDDAPHKHPETGVSLLDDVRDVIAERDAAENHRVALMTMLGVQGGSIYDASLVINGKLDEVARLTKERDAAEQTVNVVIGASVLTRDLVWCGGCKRGLSRTGNWYHCPRYGGKIDQESYRQAKEEAERNGGDIDRYISGEGADRIKALDAELSALRAELEAVKGERDRQYEFNAGQIAKYAALEAEHEKARVRLEAVKRQNLALKGDPEAVHQGALAAIESMRQCAALRVRLEEAELATPHAGKVRTVADLIRVLRQHDPAMDVVWHDADGGCVFLGDIGVDGTCGNPDAGEPTECLRISLTEDEEDEFAAISQTAQPQEKETGR